MGKSISMCLFIFFITAGNCFAVSFNQIELVSSSFSDTNWGLSTDIILTDPISPTVTYSVNSEGPYPMPLSSVFGGAFWIYLDDTTVRYPGKLPSDFNGSTFSWNVADTANSLYATGVVSGIRNVPLSKDLNITGNDIHPTISWSNSDVLLDDYNIRLFDASGALLGQWPIPLSPNPSFTFTGFSFEIGKNYKIRVEARDFEFFDLHDDSGNQLTLRGKVNNRSNSEIPYSFGVSFNHLQVYSDNDAKLGWSLGTACILNNAVSPTVGYSVDGSASNPMIRVTVPYFQSMHLYDATVTEQLGGSPSDYNTGSFTWTVEDAENDLSATAIISSGIRQLPFSTDCAITGDPIHPTVSWYNADPNLSSYRVGVTDQQDNILYQSPDLKFSLYGASPAYILNNFTMEPGLEYKIRIEAREYIEFPFQQGSYIPSSPRTLLLINRSRIYLTHLVRVRGDLNGDTLIDLQDVIIALQVVAGLQTDISVDLDNTIIADRIGLEEALFALQSVADLR